jgi:hypothetical protein
MNICTISLYTYEITKGSGERKVLRKPYRSIKVSGFGKVLSFLPFPLATELRKNSGGLLCHLRDGLRFQIFLPGCGRGALEGSYRERDIFKLRSLTLANRAGTCLWQLPTRVC